MGHRKEYGYYYGGKKLQVVRIKLEPQYYHHYDVVHYASDYHKQQPHVKLTALAERGIAQNLSDYYGGKAYNDGAPAHVYIGEALILGHKSSRESHHSV